MAPLLTGHESLRRLFAALTEQTFQVELGVADPPLTDYLVDLLVRFTRIDAIYRLRDTAGKRLEEVAEMLIEADQRPAKSQREVYRHIGDFTLFWSGVYPEALARLRAADKKDHLIDYRRRGKESYLLASTFNDEPYREEAPVLRQLSEEFELCTMGLQRVRREWERMPAESSASEADIEKN